MRERAQDAAGGHGKVVRVMPNVATLVGETAAAMAMGPGCSEADEATVKSLFNAVGVIHKVRGRLGLSHSAKSVDNFWWVTYSGELVKACHLHLSTGSWKATEAM